MDCQGLGYQYGASLTQKPEIMQKSAAGLMRLLWREKYSAGAFHLFEVLLKEEGIEPQTPLTLLPVSKIQLLINGSPPDKWYQSPKGFKFRWAGISQVFAKAGKSACGEMRDAVVPLLEELECLSCQGTRLNPLARHVTINGISIGQLCRMPIEHAYAFIENLKTTSRESKLLEEALEQLKNKLRFLCEVGLHYLSLERRAPTLSGGEAQRIRLARQFGSGLTGVLYVLDEPTIGLHSKDNDRLNQALRKLKELGNTLIMVEHDLQTIATADYLLDFGPRSGEHGGHIIARGTIPQIKRSKNSLTGGYLSGKLSIPLPEKRRAPADKFLSIENASVNNLKNISVSIPVGLMTCFTGVSGSGKSTLMQQVLLPAVELGINSSSSGAVFYKEARIHNISCFDKVISIDQNPIGHTARSDVGTYVDLLGRMRELFASLPLARSKGLQGKHFSYNHRRGMCTGCWGLGYKRIQMHFLPPIRVACEDCKGLRLNPVSLEVQYAGKNFGQYLEMTVDQVRAVFANHPRIVRPLDTLISVGLGYLKLGQEMASLSGGEAQRIKISRELAKRSTGKTLYLLDEPSIGLHSEDIKLLIAVLQKLVDKGNTMVIIEHNLDIIKCADYLIDLGPDAGEAGGEVVCAGTPEQVASHPSSWTAYYLHQVLKF
jgi:excinuclease ABC subunit A